LKSGNTLRRILATAGGYFTLLMATAVAGAPTGFDPCAQPSPDWVFCSGFEEGSLEIWDDYDGNPTPYNEIVSDPGPLDQDGNHVMRLWVPPGRGLADLIKVLPQGYDRLYARWAILWEPGYDFEAPNHGGGIYAGSRDLLGISGFRPDGTDRFIASVEPQPPLDRLNIYTYYPGMYQDCVDPDGSCWGDHFPCMLDEGSNYCTNPDHRETVLPPLLETGRWYCIELMLDAGTPVNDPAAADGVLDFWVDGEEIGPWTGLWFRSIPELQLNLLWLKLFHHAEHADAGIRIDEVVVSTQPIGCPGANTPAEASSWGKLKGLYR
jgi:hypothetical protein